MQSIMLILNHIFYARIIMHVNLLKIFFLDLMDVTIYTSMQQCNSDYSPFIFYS